LKVDSKNYGRQYAPLLEEITAAIQNALLNEKPILGVSVAAFERDLAAAHGVGHAIGVGSGTDAIILTLGALGIGPGDEVITCSHTFSGVVSAILQCGATPVLVEPDEWFQLPVEGCKAAITDATKAILAVHFYGHPVDADGLAELACRNELLLVEDAAQAHGAQWNGKPIGSFGIATATSFHPSKNLGAFGDAGAILTNNTELAEKLRILRNLGKDGKYRFELIGPNSKLDTLQAAILVIKLRHLEAWVERRGELAAIYQKGLEGVGDMVLPKTHPKARHAWHLYVVRTKQRDALMAHLKKAGIKAGLHYPIPAHLQPSIAEKLGSLDLPIAAAWADEVLTLPLSHEHSDEELELVVEEVRNFFGES
jgi:dTDP-4-amino-4,6-dideoxygalactose transaminase